MIVSETVAVGCFGVSALSTVTGLLSATSNPDATGPDTAKYLLYTAVATLITGIPAMAMGIADRVVKIRANDESIRVANARADQAEQLAKDALARADRAQARADDFEKRADETDRALSLLRSGLSQGQKWMAATALANAATPANIPPPPPPIHASDPDTHVLTGEGFTAVLTEPSKDA